MPNKTKVKVNLSVPTESKVEEEPKAQPKPQVEKHGSRVNASFLSRFFYTYAKPIYDLEGTDSPYTKEQIPDPCKEESVRYNADIIEKEI